MEEKVKEREKMPVDEKLEKRREEMLKKVIEQDEQRYGKCTCDPTKLYLCDACTRRERARKGGFALRIL